jgi:short subunit fatty acids transporter
MMSGSVLAILAGLVLYVRPLLYIKAINSAVGLVSAVFEGKAVAGSRKGLVFAS